MSVFNRLAELERAGKPAALATVIRVRGSVPRQASSKMLIYPDGSIDGTIGGGEMEARVVEEALESLKDGRPRVLEYAFRDPEKGDVGVCGGEMEVYVEPIRPRPTIVVVGGGHVGAAVVHLAHWLDFRVVVSDDRPRFSSEEEVPGADEYLHCELAELPEKIEITDQTYLVLTTRGVSVDVEGLPALLDTPATYIGVIGSRRRWETAAEILAEKGIPEEKLNRVISPMGLELNAETPEEIAVSIIAEIIMHQRGGTGGRMRHEVAQRASKGT